MSKYKSYPEPGLCKGCLLCLDACPKGALLLSAEANQMGFQTVSVDRDRCVGCGNCYRVCPDYVYEIREKAG